MEVSPPIDFSAMFADICEDNEDAKALCWTLLDFVHYLDDTVDGDKPRPTAEAVAKTSLNVLLCFAFNKFWMEHKAALRAILIQATQAWVDSVAWEKSEDVRQRRAADVLKSQYAEVFFHIAFILGGTERLRAVTTKWRIYNYDAA